MPRDTIRIVRPGGVFFVPPPPGWGGPASGLTHRWPLDNANAYNDVVGGLTGTPTGGIANATGPSGNPNTAKAFDGTGYLTLPSNPITLASAHSVFCWVLMTNNNPATSERMWAFDDDLNNACVGFLTGTTTGGAVNGVFEGGPRVAGVIKSQFSTGTAILSGVWTHLGYTFDATTTILYANGSAIAMTAGTDVTTNVNAEAQTSKYFIAARGDATRELFGSLAELVTYNRVLSGAEATTLMNAF